MQSGRGLQNFSCSLRSQASQKLFIISSRIAPASTDLNKHDVYSLRGEIRVSVEALRRRKSVHVWSEGHTTNNHRIDPLQRREIPAVGCEHSHKIHCMLGIPMMSTYLNIVVD